jgi:predicted Rossmann fold flavoprotein
VGAGAAGLATAIFTRRASPDADVVVLEGARRPGAKILVSGGTRCNVTNAVVTERDFSGGKASIVRRVLKAFPAPAARAFFEDLGVGLHEEAGGKLFPNSNRARDVLEALLRESSRAGVRLYSGCRVFSVTTEERSFLLNTAMGALHASQVVLATGGLSLPRSGSDGAGLTFARSLGHTIVPTTPALVPLTLAEPGVHDELAGVSHDAVLTVWVNGAKRHVVSGPLLWTHTGVSGPAALDASRHYLRAELDAEPPSMTMNVWGGRTFEDVESDLLGAAHSSPRSSLRSIVSERVPASVADALMRASHIDRERTMSHLSRDERRRLAHALTSWPLAITGSRGYNHAEVTAGGVALDEIDPSTMESRVCPGLWLVGEMLDADGRLGGFNFQWAWSTAFVAARGLTTPRRTPPRTPPRT